MIHRAITLRNACPPATSALRCRFSSTLVDSVVREGDTVLLSSGPPKNHEYLTKPLTPGLVIQSHFGAIPSQNIIGKQYRSLVQATNGNKALRVLVPTLEEYATISPRLVTPIYSPDANLIVSLLDLHVLPPLNPTSEAYTSPKLEILEAGTGHGSLTLHLARAIHTANPPLPASLRGSQPQDDAAVAQRSEALAQWKSTRRAVVHTIELKEQHSLHAEKIVSGFRHGMYAPHVDFHVGNVADFIAAAQSRNERPFSHIILDLPDAHTQVPNAARALRDGGTLVLFCPSVTQIAQAVRAVREQGLPLFQHQVLELGAGISGGKQWDVRAAKVRKHVVTTPSQSPVNDRTLFQRWGAGLARLLGVKPQEPKVQAEAERWEMVARPLVGGRIVGGGFVGVWRRMVEWEAQDVPVMGGDSKAGDETVKRRGGRSGGRDRERRRERTAEGRADAERDVDSDVKTGVKVEGQSER